MSSEYFVVHSPVVSYTQTVYHGSSFKLPQTSIILLKTFSHNPTKLLPRIPLHIQATGPTSAPIDSNLSQFCIRLPCKTASTHFSMLAFLNSSFFEEQSVNMTSAKIKLNTHKYRLARLIIQSFAFPFIFISSFFTKYPFLSTVSINTFHNRYYTHRYFVNIQLKYIDCQHWGF